LLSVAAPGAEPSAPSTFELRAGDRMIGGGQYQAWDEFMLTSRFPDRAITFRNLG
jgi:hypothetical protein